MVQGTPNIKKSCVYNIFLKFWRSAAEAAACKLCFCLAAVAQTARLLAAAMPKRKWARGETDWLVPGPPTPAQAAAPGFTWDPGYTGAGPGGVDPPQRDRRRGGGRPPPAYFMTAFGRLHNSGGPPSAAPHCCGFHNGGWGEKWLDKVDETFLKAFAIVSNTFHQLYLAICSGGGQGGSPLPARRRRS